MLYEKGVAPDTLPGVDMGVKQDGLRKACISHKLLERINTTKSEGRQIWNFQGGS